MSRRVLERFTAWFCSPGGVWQTTLVVLAVVAVELCDRSLDPHAFLLMAVLTVYSAVTQPALAFSNELSAAQMEAMLDKIERLEERLVAAIEEAR